MAAGEGSLTAFSVTTLAMTFTDGGSTRVSFIGVTTGTSLIVTLGRAISLAALSSSSCCTILVTRASAVLRSWNFLTGVAELALWKATNSAVVAVVTLIIGFSSWVDDEMILR